MSLTKREIDDLVERTIEWAKDRPFYETGAHLLTKERWDAHFYFRVEAQLPRWEDDGGQPAPETLPAQTAIYWSQEKNACADCGAPMDYQTFEHLHWRKCPARSKRVVAVRR